MPRLIGNLPHDVYVGFSGGMDSVFALHFLARGARTVRPFIFDHGTGSTEAAVRVLDELRTIPALNIAPTETARIKTQKKEYESDEMFWRRERYDHGFFTLDGPVITAHHLNDVAENYLITAFRGNPRLIPYRNGNVIRPFLLFSKFFIENYIKNYELPYWEDPANANHQYVRARVRHVILPEVLQANPGFLTTIKNKVLLEYEPIA